MLKLLMKKGILFYKKSQPIKVNITLWIIIDIHPFIEKQKNIEKKGIKKIQELALKDYGVDFPNYFDIIIDTSKYSNVDILGTEYLRFQDNLILDRFTQNIASDFIETNTDFVFDFKELKCNCKSYH